MCRAALNRRQFAKVPACAPRHIGAHWTTTLPRSPPALAPGTAPLALRNARLPKDTPRYASVPRLRVRALVRARAHVPGRAQASPVGQCPSPRAPSHRRSPDHHPPPLTTGACARHCSASAPQCPATERRSPVRERPPPASARTQASSAAQWPRLPQAPGAATEPLSGPQPASADTTVTCAGHCRAGARQCPANPNPPRCTSRPGPARSNVTTHHAVAGHHTRTAPTAATARAPHTARHRHTGRAQTPRHYPCDGDSMRFGQWI